MRLEHRGNGLEYTFYNTCKFSQGSAGFNTVNCKKPFNVFKIKTTGLRFVLFGNNLNKGFKFSKVVRFNLKYFYLVKSVK